jgi:hypothetical protein
MVTIDASLDELTGATIIITATTDRLWHESAIGTKRTSNYRPAMSAFGGKADIRQTRINVRL